MASGSLPDTIRPGVTGTARRLQLLNWCPAAWSLKGDTENLEINRPVSWVLNQLVFECWKAWHCSCVYVVHTVRRRVEFWCTRHCAVKCLSTWLMTSISSPKATDDPFGLPLITCAVPRTRNRFGDRSFGAVGPRILNSLLCGLRTLDISYKHFKTLLKTYMFRQGYGALWHST